MSLQSILEDNKAKLNALLTYANGATGASDTNIGNAIKTLVDGYGGGSVSSEELVGSLEWDINLANDTTFNSVTPSTTNQVVLANVNNSKVIEFADPIDLDLYDMKYVQVSWYEYKYKTESPTKVYPLVGINAALSYHPIIKTYNKYPWEYSTSRRNNSYNNTYPTALTYYIGTNGALAFVNNVTYGISCGVPQIGNCNYSNSTSGTSVSTTTVYKYLIRQYFHSPAVAVRVGTPASVNAITEIDAENMVLHVCVLAYKVSKNNNFHKFTQAVYDFNPDYFKQTDEENSEN